ncbi:DUF1853 family protein [Halomonas huangheensis]|uniref:DUF1853 domain-containing protein n=1 Tax=Halomonas huangheensis TaxID=1178482 RepID=W1NBS4_9GAMM|nr:DUF1853 family protein [Halomonas huangheensis]ALM52490.1 hypothetical protein AR456_09525 [Halomonas huangheensis]ERL53012.1 hypothetical protein BJB45_17180 [Halomonas huangheensis]
MPLQPDILINPLGKTLKHPLVRDLAWLMAAPDLVQTRWPGRPDLATLGFESSGALETFLQQLDSHPQPLEDWLGNNSSRRLGPYHEHLWQFLLHTSPNTELLAHNIPVRVERRTLGELDLIYRAHDSDLRHLEVAVKFYLGIPQGPQQPDSAARWIGPGGLDSLALKVSHLSRHQLPLMFSPAARLALTERFTELGIQQPPQPPQPQLAMPGVLFRPWHAPSLPLPAITAPGALQGLWCHWRDWSKLCSEHPTLQFGSCLTRPHWLAPPRPDHWQSQRTLSRTLAAHFATWATPVQLMLCRDPLEFAASPLPHPANDNAPPEQVGRRIFVVSDDWPRQIPLPPATSCDPGHQLTL